MVTSNNYKRIISTTPLSRPDSNHDVRFFFTFFINNYQNHVSNRYDNRKQYIETKERKWLIRYSVIVAECTVLVFPFLTWRRQIDIVCIMYFWDDGIYFASRSCLIFPYFPILSSRRRSLDDKWYLYLGIFGLNLSRGIINTRHPIEKHRVFQDLETTQRLVQNFDIPIKKTTSCVIQSSLIIESLESINYSLKVQKNS